MYQFKKCFSYLMKIDVNARSNNVTMFPSRLPFSACHFYMHEGKEFRVSHKQENYFALFS